MTKMRSAVVALVCVVCTGRAFAETVKVGHGVRPAGMICDESKTIEITMRMAAKAACKR
jgi:hypothetical protein